MNGFISNKVDLKHTSIFTESSNAEEYLKRFLPDNGDREHYCSDEDDTWIQLVNKNGRLWIGVGEPGA